MPSRSPGRKTPRQGKSATRGLVKELKSEPNELKRKLMLLGFLSDHLSKNGGVIFLVGGQAVETYTAAQFTTGDIDVTTTDKEETEKFLGSLGFKKEGMIWLNEQVGMAVHIVGSYPSRPEKSRTLVVGKHKVRVVGVEELIVDRLKAAKRWKSERDKEQAVVLFESFKEVIDMDYLAKRARDEGVERILPSRRRLTGY